MLVKDFKNIIPEFKKENVSISFVNISIVERQLEEHGSISYRKLLTEWEYEYLNNIKVLKRKSDFLAGRLAGKKAVMSYTMRMKNQSLQFSDIEIKKMETGEPSIYINNNSSNMLISISHSGIFATAIVVNYPDYAGIGIDIEKIEKRDESFLDVAFNQSEIAIIKSNKLQEFNNPETGKDGDITKYWTIKESVLKSLSSGLNMDLKDIEIIESDSDETEIKMRNDVKDRFNELGVNGLNIKSFEFDEYVVSISSMN